MSGLIEDLMNEVPKNEMLEMPVESSTINRFVIGLRDALTKLNDTLLDRFRQVDDDLAQLRASPFTEGNVAEKIAQFDSVTKHQAELKTQIVSLEVDVKERVDAIEKKFEESGPRRHDAAQKRDMGNIKDLAELMEAPIRRLLSGNGCSLLV